jgi:glycosyltransferase involved in cell wall biosynthesis
MISRDVKALDQSSAVFERLKEYAGLFDELHVVVMGRKSNLKSLHIEKLKIYNASSHLKLVSVFKTFLVGLKLARKNKSGDTWITSQDPFESGLLAFIIAKFAKIKLQLQFHTDCFNMLYIKHSFSNYFRALIARLLVTRADSIRVVSERIRKSLSTFLPAQLADQGDFRLSTRIFILPIWTDISKIEESAINPDHNLRNKFSEFKKIILIVARLEAEKNIELSLFAFKKALRFNPDLGLVIAGNGRKEKWLKRLVKSLNIETNVRFIGWVSDVQSLFKTSDMLLVTSFYEGYGLNMVETAACGCPVVATDVGVAKEIGAVVVPYDAGQIALKVIEVLDQDQRLEIPSQFITSKQEYLNRFKNTFQV